MVESRGLTGLLEIDARDGVVGWCPPTSGTPHAGRRRPRAAAARHALPTASPRCSSSYAPPPGRALGELRLRPLRLHRADAARNMGMGAGSRLGRGARRRPGPDVGAGLPRRRSPRAAARGCGGRVRPVRLEKGESQRWRERHEARLDGLVEGLRSLGSSPCSSPRRIGRMCSGRSSTGRPSVRRAWGTQHDREACRPHRLPGDPRDPRRATRSASCGSRGAARTPLAGDARDARRLRADHARRAHLRRSGRRDGRGRRRCGRHRPRHRWRRDRLRSLRARRRGDGRAGRRRRDRTRCLPVSPAVPQGGLRPIRAARRRSARPGLRPLPLRRGVGARRHILDWPPIEVASPSHPPTSSGSGGARARRRSLARPRGIDPLGSPSCSCARRFARRDRVLARPPALADGAERARRRRRVPIARRSSAHSTSCWPTRGTGPPRRTGAERSSGSRAEPHDDRAGRACRGRTGARLGTGRRVERRRRRLCPARFRGDERRRPCRPAAGEAAFRRRRRRSRARAAPDAPRAPSASPCFAIGLLAAAFHLSRDLKALPTSYFATGSGGIVVLDLSSSVDQQKAQRAQRVIRSMAETEGRIGLVVFSDTAYEMLPPDTRSEGAFVRSLRFFEAPPGGFQRPGFRAASVHPSTPHRRRRRRAPRQLSFRGGTKISTGLAEARRSSA